MMKYLIMFKVYLHSVLLVQKLGLTLIDQKAEPNIVRTFV